MSKQKVFALIDCNNFFVSCERVLRPDIWNKPVAVLSNNDGCIIARSNEVKELGVPMGVPLFKVKDILKQHNTTLFSANFALYGDLSQRITSIISQASPCTEVYSIDESFADLTNLAGTDYEKWGLELKERIWRCTGVPVSIGIGPSKTLAKAAADYAKKERSVHGVCVAVSERAIKELLLWLPLEDIWGIGRRLAPKLRLQGVRCAYDLVGVSDKWILKELTVKGLATVSELRGQSVIPFDNSSTARKSIGRSRSFGHTIRNYHQLESALATFTAQAAAKLRAQSSVAPAIVSYIRTRAQDQAHRSLVTTTYLAEPTADTGRLIEAALKGLSAIYDDDFGYDKAGILLADIHGLEAWQLSLIDPDKKRNQRAELMKTMDDLNKKFGSTTIWHASQNISMARWQSKHELRSPAYTTSWSDVPVLKA